MSPAPKIYRGPGWEIRSGRWEDSPPESVDVVISDPPYDERTHKTARLGGSQYGGKDGGSGKVVAAPAISFEPIDPIDVGPPLINLSRRWVILFCAVEQFGEYENVCGAEYIRAGQWLKTNPKPQFSGDRPGQGFEGIAILHRKGRKRWNRGGHSAVWIATAPIGRANELRLHETEKPLSLMIDLVRDFSDRGELVWDPYAGAGTTGVACLRHGRRFLGHEMQEYYAEIAAERLTAEEKGLNLIEARREHPQITLTELLKNHEETTPAAWLEQLMGEK